MKLIPAIALSVLVAVVPLAAHAQRADGAAGSLALTTQEVDIHSGGITLSGTLLVPSQPMAAVVLVHGSAPGQEVRMLEFARWFAENDVAALTYDKRGIGRSGGVYAGPSVGTNNVEPAYLGLLAGDASAAVEELGRRFASGRTPPIGIFGISQAGWVVPLAAVRTPPSEVPDPVERTAGDHA